MARIPKFKKSFQEIILDGEKAKAKAPKEFDIDLDTIPDIEFEEVVDKLEDSPKKEEEVVVDKPVEKIEEPVVDKELEDKTKEIKAEKSREREQRLIDEAVAKAIAKTKEELTPKETPTEK